MAKKYLDSDGVLYFWQKIKAKLGDKADSSALSSLTNIVNSKSTVTYTSNLSSGTKIGTITINGTTTNIYCETNTDTHYTSKNVVGSSTSLTNTTSVLTNGNVYLNSVENNSVTSSHRISGTGTIQVTTDTSGNIIINSTGNTINYSFGTGINTSNVDDTHVYVYLTEGEGIDITDGSIDNDETTDDTKISIRLADESGLIKNGEVSTKSEPTYNGLAINVGQYLTINSDNKLEVNKTTLLSDYSTTSQVNTLIQNALQGITEFSIEIVDSLPSTGTTGVFYLVPNSSSSSSNSYTEYVWIASTSKFEVLGEFQTTVDLSGYLKETDLVAITNAEIDTIVGS